MSADKRETGKSSASNQKSNNSQSQSSGNSRAEQSQQLLKALQSFLPLLQELLQKFGNSNPPQPQPDSEPMPYPNPDPEPAPSRIVGTENDDRLEGTGSRDIMEGLAGDDLLIGRQGDDTLFGASGNDELLGGDGDDLLVSGDGNDYLSGGTGSNQLLGGVGNDTLVSRFGSDISTTGLRDVLDGGQGNDIANISGNIDDYSVDIRRGSTSPQPGWKITNNSSDVMLLEVLVLTNKETGQTVEATNIEQFKFNDESFSLAEMRQRAETDQVDLSSSQRDNLLTLLGESPGPRGGTDFAYVSVEDKDNNGKVSVGDVASLHKGDGSDPSSVSREFKTLTAEDVAKINGEVVETPSGLELEAGGGLTREQADHFGPIVYNDAEGFRSIISINDSDNNGKLSAGDLLTGTAVGYGGVEQDFTHTVTQDDIDGYLNTSSPEELELSQKQHNAISQHFDDLSPLAFDGQATEYTGTTLDKNGDNKLSVGDVVELRHFGGNSPLPSESIEAHVLTEADITAINDLSSRESVPLSHEEKSQLQQAVFRQDVLYIPEQIPYLADVIDNDDNDDNGKLSVGDTIQINTPTGTITEDPTGYWTQDPPNVRFETLTQAQLDRYEAGISYDPSNIIDLNGDQTKALQELFNLSPGQSFHTVLDSNNDGKLSVGDQMEYFPDDERIWTSEPVPSSHIFTADDIAKINGETEIPSEIFPLNDTQRNTISQTLGINSEVTVFDSDRSGSISEGDTILGKFTNDTAGTESFVHTINADFAAEINGELGKPLDISEQQSWDAAKALNISDLFSASSFSQILDRDGSSKISEGDVLKLIARDPNGQTTNQIYHTISADNIQTLKEAGIVDKPTFTTINAGTDFSIQVPSGSEFEPKQGFDSIVGEINTPDYQLTFDLGRYGGINNQFEGRENYQTKDLQVDGKDATIATYFDSREGTENPYRAAIKIELGNDRSLTLHAKLESPDQYADVEQAFKSIKLDVQEDSSFFSWFSKTHGDVNGDNKVDKEDVVQWLKGDSFPKGDAGGPGPKGDGDPGLPGKQ